jgi:hypothetical protein
VNDLSRSPTCKIAIQASRTLITAPSPDLVISEVYGGGGNSGAPHTLDILRGGELVNLVETLPRPERY